MWKLNLIEVVYLFSKIDFSNWILRGWVWDWPEVLHVHARWTILKFHFVSIYIFFILLYATWLRSACMHPTIQVGRGPHIHISQRGRVVLASGMHAIFRLNCFSRGHVRVWLLGVPSRLHCLFGSYMQISYLLAYGLCYAYFFRLLKSVASTHARIPTNTIRIPTFYM